MTDKDKYFNKEYLLSLDWVVNSSKDFEIDSLSSSDSKYMYMLKKFCYKTDYYTGKYERFLYFFKKEIIENISDTYYELYIYNVTSRYNKIFRVNKNFFYEIINKFEKFVKENIDTSILEETKERI